MIEQTDALNKRNQYKLNLLQRKVDEKDQLIVGKDATIAEKDGAINTYRSTIATLTQQLAELRLVRSTEERMQQNLHHIRMLLWIYWSLISPRQLLI